MRVLHLSADYPDPLASAKTRAVANLLALAPEVEHRVWSLNRIGGRAGWRGSIEAIDFADAAGGSHRAVAYGAPSAGLFLIRYLTRLADWIAEDASARGVTPTLIHAHKLTIEGVVGLRLAERFGVPLLVSVQGNTDLKILNLRPDLRPMFRRIWRRAAVALPFAPWAAAGVELLLGRRAGHLAMLPCPMLADRQIAPRLVGPLFRTAFHFRDAGNKNAPRLIHAVQRAARVIPEMRLEIVGGGDAGWFGRLSSLASQATPGRVTFLGTVANDQMQSLFNGACAMPLLSHRETFGMVFAEALMAGTPCLYSRGRAIDGYFEEGGAVLAADPSDEVEIAAALERLAREEAAFKARLAALAEAGGLDFLARPAIAATYRTALAKALAQPANEQTATSRSTPTPSSEPSDQSR